MRQAGCFLRLRVLQAARPLHPATPRLRLISSSLPKASPLPSSSSRLPSELSSGSSYLPQTISSLLRDGPSSQGRVSAAEAAAGAAASSPADATETETATPAATATINGWIKSIRKMGKIVFAHISDGSTLTPVQVVLEKTQAAG